MIINNIAMGFLPQFEDGQTIDQLNNALPYPMSIVGDYISVSAEDTSLPQYEQQKANLLSLYPSPVYMATIMPVDGLYSFDSSQADAVSYAMNDLNNQGFTVWIRFGYEMNGCPAWNAWGCDPAGFIQAWNIMTASLRANAPGCYMMWSPNIDPATNSTYPGNYAQYYPGDSQVDLIGLSLYWFGYQQHQNTLPSSNFFINSVTPFYNQFVGPKNKPFVVAETGAAYHYVLDTSTPAPGGATEYNIKTQWFDQLFGTSTKSQFPLYIGAVWFNYDKDENRNGTMQTVDYRCLLGNAGVQTATYHLDAAY